GADFAFLHLAGAVGQNADLLAGFQRAVNSWNSVLKCRPVRLVAANEPGVELGCFLITKMQLACKFLGAFTALLRVGKVPALITANPLVLNFCPPFILSGGQTWFFTPAI